MRITKKLQQKYAVDYEPQNLGNHSKKLQTIVVTKKNNVNKENKPAMYQIQMREEMAYC